MGDDDDGNEYRWETGYEKTWEAIKEDDDGMLEASVADIIQKAKRNRQAAKCNHNRLGMMRHLYVVIDWSDCMSNQDLKPTRLLCTLKILEGFIEEFFDQNPISQLGIIIARNKRAEKISELAGNPRNHIKALTLLKGQPGSGEMSLQNSLELAMASLRNVPSHASREVLVLMGSLTTCDPGDITVSIRACKNLGLRCSVIGLAAEVHVCRLLANETSGRFGVVLDDAHFRDQLLAHVEPSAAAASLPSSLIRMGFPHHQMQQGKEAALSMCMCHVQSGEVRLSAAGYYCPQCGSKYCQLPMECVVCALTLVSAPHLARSYHHLFPVDTFLPRDHAPSATPANANANANAPAPAPATHCFACRRAFGQHDKQVFACPRCRQLFCLECDLFVHDTLHTCPGCATNLPAAPAPAPAQR